MKKTNVKNIRNTKMKNENGSITLYVVISMIFFLVIVTSLYFSSTNRVYKQNKEIYKIQKQYNQNIDDIYEKAVYDNLLMSKK